MHLGFITSEYPSTNLGPSGGLGTSIRNLAQGLVEKDVEVTVFVIAQKVDLHFTDGKIKIISIAKKKHIALNWYIERKRIQQIIQQYIDSRSLDILEAPDWTGISAFMKFSIPLVIRLHGSDSYFCHLDGRKQKWKHYFLEKTALKNADKIVSVSSFTGSLTKKIFKLSNEIVTIHNSINKDDFQPLAIETDPNMILYFGTVIRKKGVLELAQAFNILIEKEPRVKLVLLGKDTLDYFTKTSTISLFKDLLSEKASKHVEHINEVPYEEVKKHIATAQVITLPSFAEAFPMTWLETLILKKPLVSSNIGWAKELMINDVTGFTVDPKNYESYAQKLQELLNNSQKRILFGEHGRKHVIENFSSDVIAEKNILFYKNVINN